MNNTHMKHFLITAALLVCNLAHAGASSQAGTAGTGTMIAWTPGMRVRHYESHRNTMTAAGEILVCPAGMDTLGWSTGQCVDTAKQNAWKRLEELTPSGMRILGIDYRLSGSGGYRSMFIYYVPK